MEAPVQSNINLEDDDKSLKEEKQRLSFFYILLAILPCGSTFTRHCVNFLNNPLKDYNCFLLLSGIVYYIVCDGETAWEDLIGYNSCILEAYGLISVIRKIQSHRSVLGISGSRLIMFAVSYGLRQCEAFVISQHFRLTKR